MTDMLEVKDLTVRFHGSGRNAVDHISFSMAPGERLGVVGESGSGKTVTAMAISGLLQRSLAEVSGTARFRELDLLHCSREELRRVQGADIGVVFQEPMTSMNPLMKVGPQIEEALKIHTRLSPAERRAKALAAMERVGLPEVEATYNKYPHQLSGGQRQRAIIASAALIRPGLLICDEPTTALDVTVQAQILKLLRGISEDEGVGILLISHDLSVVRRLCERVVVMQRGVIVEEGPVEQIYNAPRHEYTRRLIAAIPTRRKLHE